VGHVTAPELPSQEGRACSHGTHDSIGAHLGKEARSGAVGQMAAPEPTSAGRQGSELRDMWQCRNSPQQEGEVRGRRTRGGAGTHLSKEVRSGAAGHVVAPCLDLDLVCGSTRSLGCRQSGFPIC
jgi:hypothetical protein